MKKKIVLKPCPFCGSMYVLRKKLNGMDDMVECGRCKARSFTRNWNRRPLEDRAGKKTGIYRSALEKIAKTIGEKACKE